MQNKAPRIFAVFLLSILIGGCGIIIDRYRNAQIQSEQLELKKFIKTNSAITNETGEITDIWIDQYATRGGEAYPWRYKVGIWGKLSSITVAIDVSRSSGKSNFSIACTIRKGDKAPWLTAEMCN